MTSFKDASASESGFEKIPAEEADSIDEIAGITSELQDRRAKNDPRQEGKVLRGVHAKSHGCVKAEFRVRDDIDEKYQVGLFAYPGKVHQAWVRFSNASVLLDDDLSVGGSGTRENGSRGMAIKVMDVIGDMLSQDDGRSNQDFLMINTPMFAFANVRDYLRLERILKLHEVGADPRAYFIPAILAKLGPQKEGEDQNITDQRNQLSAIVAGHPLLNNLSAEDLKGTISSAIVAEEIKSKVVRNPMEVKYFGAAPFLFGPDQVMKFSVVPTVMTPQEPFENVTPENPSENYLRDAVGETMSGTYAVEYDFMIQTRTADADNLNIEDATTIWPDELESYVPVAKLTIQAPQTPHNPAEEAHCEKMAFNPWHALAAHRPVGGINRLRKKVYFDSASHRGAEGYQGAE